MPKVAKGLSPTQVQRMREPGKYFDGNGLYLFVTETGSRRWVQRVVVNGIRHEMGLGPVALVGLAEAREVALANRKLARDGINPIAERAKRKGATKTFKVLSMEYIDRQAASWSGPKQVQQWTNSLTNYAFPIFGDRSVSMVDESDVMKAVSPIWHEKHETARRVLRRIQAILDYATASKLRSGENPARIAKLGLGRQADKPKHFEAMEYSDLPAFYSRLRRLEGVSKVTSFALRWLILTAARSGEVRGAVWSEIDLNARVWSIPAERMKMSKAHKVPLTSAAVELLCELESQTGRSPSGLLFPGQRDKQMSDMTLSKAVKRMGYKVTPHGFRSTFKTWASEKTEFANEVSEAALAHQIRNQVERAYQRGDMLERRRDLMQAWAEYTINRG